jgi:predicted nucleotidyltransferase
MRRTRSRNRALSREKCERCSCETWSVKTGCGSSVPPVSPLAAPAIAAIVHFPSLWGACLVPSLVEPHGTTADREDLEITRSYGATRVRVFGSWARGGAQPDSDLDLIVDVPRGTTLFDMAALECQLEELLGIKVEVFTENSLHPTLDSFPSTMNSCSRRERGC